MENKMFAMLIHLCNHMWPDYDSTLWKGKSQKEKDDYYDNLSIDWDLFKDYVLYLKGAGVNTLLIDVGDAVKFDRHPDLNIKNALTKDECKKLLDYIRSLGITPLPKLNYSGGHDAWLKHYSNMIGTPEYYKVCADCIDEVCEVFGNPELFHLGLDEEAYKNQQNMGVATMRKADIFWRDAYKLFDRCAHNNARPWVWSDDYWLRPQEFLKYMPKEVLQSNWWYHTDFEKDENGRYKSVGFQTYIDLDRAGYDQVPTASTWADEFNIDVTMRLCKEELTPDRFKGFMSAPWAYIKKDGYNLMMHEAVMLKRAMQKHFPDKVGDDNE